MKSKVLKLCCLLFSLSTISSCTKKTNDSPIPIEERKKQLVQAFYEFTISRDGFETANANGGIIKDEDYLNATDFMKKSYNVFKYDNSDITIKLGGSTSVANIVDAQYRKFTSLFSSSSKPPSFTTDRKGSGTAVSGVKSGQYDIAYLSRELESNELKSLNENNNGHNAHFSIDAVVPIVNKDNGLTNITREQLALIYGNRDYLNTLDAFKDKESITNFSQIDSSLSGNIKVYTRDSSSGTRECFTEKIGIPGAKKDDKIINTASSESDNGSMISSVKNDINAIGYVSLDSITSNTSVKALIVEGVEPKNGNVKNGTYSLQRYFNVVTIY